MARRTKITTTHQLPLLQQRLILNRYFCRLFGFDDFKGLREKLRDHQEGYADDGHSCFYYALQGLQGMKIPLDQLADFDLRIKGYVELLNRFRTPPIQLKYFQYLAVLFTEIYLDRLFNDRNFFLVDLNKLVESENAKGGIPYNLLTDVDLTKVAFWMATGSGKTLIMHINLWQYLHYAKEKTRHDNILLITPNEGLSRQHLEELRKSGIAAEHYGEADGMLLGYSSRPITVIEITKLTESKRGGGLSVEVDAFGGSNLLFVDEAHRGASGEVWRDLRAKVAEEGFTFEYSATFGQIVNGASRNKRPALLDEYTKAILFDYSYARFYHDGYGKDYWIINLRDETAAFNEWMLLGNLLSFYEQCCVFDEQREAFRPFNLEKPLWVFVGHTVTGGKSKEDKVSLTDVEEIVDFFARFLRDRIEWIQRIEKAFRGETGLKNARNEDLFKGLFLYMKDKWLTAAEIYDDIVRRVFCAQAGETLRAVELKAASGEIGLRAGARNPYFGVINIGDVTGLLKLMEANGLSREEENISDSLFEGINYRDSTVNALIGSRKFMEGWDCYRVSSMGLMNIGKGEGAQIIQLFGRGVRLRGKSLSLKRSAALELNDVPPNIRLLETLNVFGVRANYMAQFREYLTQEGIETDYEEIHVPVKVEEAFLQRGLQVLRLPEGESFQNKAGVVLRFSKNIKVSLDLLPRLEVAKSGIQPTEEVSAAQGEDKSSVFRKIAPLFNYERIYFDLLAFKGAKGYHNLSFTLETLQEILKNGSYEVLCPDEYVSQNHPKNLRRMEEVAVGVLRKYIAAFYARQRQAWEQERARLVAMTKEDANLDFKGYHLRIVFEEESDKQFAGYVYALVEKAEEIYKQDVQDFPNIHFDRHLYQPLLVSDERIEMTPSGLNKGEKKLVADLRTYLHKHQQKLGGKEFFLLRNLTRGKGIGFFEASDGEAFYPDFILWVIEDRQQWVVFIDPHGLRYARGGFNDPKIRLHKELKILESKFQSHCVQWKAHLTSFIISTSTYDEIRKTFGTGVHTKKEFEKEHVVFQEDSDYIEKCLKMILT